MDDLLPIYEGFITKTSKSRKMDSGSRYDICDDKV